ncbi:hypothetical protein [Streptomyces sp. NPDC017529]|uniref:hypothetical protein n=1 Tax=Streptomyces sp. NPDC017529 TaxID=3365000 RepID=UPI0037BCFCDB
MTAPGEAFLARTARFPRDRRRRGVDAQPGPLHAARAWAAVLLDRSWWRLSAEDRYAYRSGVSLALWTKRQVRRSGLCQICWLQESYDGINGCEAGDCRAFNRLLWQLTSQVPGDGAR